MLYDAIKSNCCIYHAIFYKLESLLQEIDVEEPVYSAYALLFNVSKTVWNDVTLKNKIYCLFETRGIAEFPDLAIKQTEDGHRCQVYRFVLQLSLQYRKWEKLIEKKEISNDMKVEGIVLI